MADFHEAVFRWPYAGENVILTGTFDQWARSRRLVKGPSGFEGTVRVPWAQKVAYKFIVDGRWATTDLAPTELDGHGNTNNVYYAPAKPDSFTIVNEPPVVAVVPAERPQDKSPEPSAAAEGKIQVNGPPPVSPAPQDKPISSPVQEIEPVLPPVANGKPIVPAPVPQDEPISSPAETPADEPPTQPVDAKPVKAVDPAVVLPTQSQAIAPKIPLPIVPVNDSKLVSVPLVAAPDTSQSGSTPSTHTPVVNSPRKSLNSPSPLVPAEDKKKTDVTNGINGTSVAPLPSSPPSTPKKHIFPRSQSPLSPGSGSLRSSTFGSMRSKRISFFQKLKTMLTPEKHKEKHKAEH